MKTAAIFKYFELKKAIVEAWNRITLETLSRLIGSMPNRMIETLKMRGYITKY